MDERNPRGEADAAPPRTADLDTVLTGLRAAAESTRLRILAVLAEGELTVTELCRILGQTQPRVSRHLKLLCDGGLLDRHSEGTSAFYSHSRRSPGPAMLDAVLGLVDTEDRTLQADRQRLEGIRTERANAAGEYFERIAGLWDGVRSLHVADADVEQALLATADRHRIQGRRISSLLDIGTGTGRILELFADRIQHGLGIDLSAGMLNLARSNLIAEGLDHCAVRHGNVYALDVPPGSYDLAILHHVLHFLDDPAAAIAAAASALRPGGQLIVVDFAPHHLEALRRDHAHRRLGFADHEITGWCRAAGLSDIDVDHMVPAPVGGGDDTETGKSGAIRAETDTEQENQANPAASAGAETDRSRTDDLLTVGLWTATRSVREPLTSVGDPTTARHLQ